MWRITLYLSIAAFLTLPDASARAQSFTSFMNAFAGRHVSIELWEIDPDQFDDNGYATECHVKVVVRNLTPYHINKITYRIGDWDNDVPELTANSRTDSDFSISINQNDDSNSCTNQANYILGHVASSSVFTCSMQNLSEGDCQALVHISTGIGNGLAALQRIEQQHIDAASRAKQIAAAHLRTYNKNAGSIFAVAPDGGTNFSYGPTLGSTSNYSTLDKGTLLRIVRVHQSGAGVDDGYFIAWEENGAVQSGWVDADSFNTAIGQSRDAGRDANPASNGDQQ